MKPAEVRRRMSALTEHVSAEDYKRLDRLLGVFPNEPQGRARLSDCLARVATGGKVEDQLASFRAFRQRLARGAKASGLGWTLEVDSKKRSEPADRECWFLASPDDKAAASVAELFRQETAAIQDEPFIPPRGLPAMGRRLVRLFVSYDEKHDGAKARYLIENLEANFRLSRNHAYEVWDQGKILAGETRGLEIEKAFARSDFVLILLSKHRLAGSEEDVSLRELVESGRPVIPVALESLLDRFDLRGLEAQQIFRSKRGSFSECSDSDKKESFVNELFEAIEKRLDRWVEETETQSPVQWRTTRARRAGLAAHRRGRFNESMARELMTSHAPDPEALSAFVHSTGAEASLAEDLDRVEPDRSEARAVNMLEALQRWVRDPAGTRYAAILGEYGMGKTTLLRKLTDELLLQRASDPSLPLPIFIDLRYYSETIQKEARVPRNIEALLGEAIDRAWRSTRSEVDPEDILGLVREEGALLIFDGLDEKLVHLTEAQGQAFIRTLWQALPPRSPDAQQAGASLAKRDPRSAGTSGRLIFSCRSHYFKTLRSQSALFLGEDREGLRSASYRAWVLLPFNEQQIRLYLANVLGKDRVDAAMELFGAVHNLRDLAQRPYLLSVIAEHIDALERKRLRGETIRGVTIYNLLVERWLERDNGKHKLRPEDKIRLMEEVAGTMWSQGSRVWPWEQLRDWLGARLAADDVLRMRYANIASEVLEEDIRTATFILRPDTSEREFRFAHTSLLEFFLARYLFRALVNGVIETWKMAARANPSPEAFDFLGQLILNEPDSRIREKCLATISAMLGGDYPEAAEGAFRYWVLAIQRGLPASRPSRMDLRGTDLSNLVVRGRSATDRLNLRHADLSGAKLVGSVWENVDLSGAILVGARAERAEFLGALASDIDVSGADLVGAIWRGCDARGLRGGDSAQWYGCHWIDSLIDIESLPPRFGRLGTVSSGPACTGGIPSLETRTRTAQRVALGAVSGHRDVINACAWSPDGTQLLSGSADMTLKVWDARTVEELLTLRGHHSWIGACAWSPDGTQVISGSLDSTLRVWDAQTGEELLTLTGHGSAVRACAWSPDGTQVAGSLDKTLKVWDVGTGEELRTFAGHEEWVETCAWSPDGTQLLSGSNDRTLKVWDARTGKELRTLAGHSEEVHACAWSPDGAQVLSGSDDHTLKVWDARTGEERRTLAGHGAEICACAWSPDGTQVLSGSADFTLKVWDPRTGEELRTLVGHSFSVWACAWSPDATQVLSGSGTTLKIWDVRTGEELRTLNGRYSPVRVYVWWSPDGAQVLSGSLGTPLKVWDSRTGEELWSLAGPSNLVYAYAGSPDGTQVISGSDDNTLKVWDAETGEELRVLAGHESIVAACAWSPDGMQVLSGSADHTLKVWDAQTGKELTTLAGHGSEVVACAWSPDGKQVLSGSADHTLKVWDAQTGKELRTLAGHGSGVVACAWSPEGKRVLSGSEDNTLKVWDPRTGEELRTLVGHGSWVLACAWSPDGTQVLSGSLDNTLKVWEAQTGKELRTLAGHGSAVLACAWSPNGTALLSGSEDDTLKVWDARTGSLILTLTNLPDQESAALDLANNRVVWASPGAWRYLGWQFYDEDAKRLRVLPAEHFGPLPGSGVATLPPTR